LPAVARGNLIEVGNTWLNVEEACSGIRSLQTAFMTSLFFGEFYRCGLFGRIMLVLSSFVLAFLLNVGRTLVLAYGAASQGPETVDRWHDTVGNIVMVACLGGLWLLAEGISRFSGRTPAAASPEARRVPVRAPFPAWLA